MTCKRESYLDWDTYFMGVAFLSALRSKDPNTRNGSCIVSDDKKIIGTGYNGFPLGCKDDDFPWARSAENREDTKYPYVIHSEANAILNATCSLKGSTLYLYSEKGYYPCCECAKLIIQSGIQKVKVAFVITHNTDQYNWDTTKKMFSHSGVMVDIIHDIKHKFCSIKNEFGLFIHY